MRAVVRCRAGRSGRRARPPAARGCGTPCGGMIAADSAEGEAPPDRDGPARPRARLGLPQAARGTGQAPAAAMFFSTTSIVCCSSPARAELDDLRACVQLRGVAGRRVVGVARLVRLLVPVGERERQLPLEHVPHVRALAPVVGEPREERSEIGVRGVPLEPDRVGAEVLEVAFVPLDLERLGCTRLRCLGHRLLLSDGISGSGRREHGRDEPTARAVTAVAATTTTSWHFDRRSSMPPCASCAPRAS